MLTKTDLKKLGTLIDQRLEIKLDQKLDEKLKPVKNDLSTIKKDVLRVEKKIDELSEYVVPALGNIFKWTDDLHKVFIGKSPQTIHEN